jgi:hypothetical protein
LGQGDIALFTPWFAFETRSYHSGPLSLLLDYGLPGLLLGLWLAGLVLRRFWQTAVRLAKIDTIESRYALFLSVFVLWQWVAFFLVFGSIVTLANMIATLAAAMVVSNSVLGRSADEDTGANLNGVPLKNYAGKK